MYALLGIDRPTTKPAKQPAFGKEGIKVHREPLTLYFFPDKDAETQPAKGGDETRKLSLLA